MTIVKWKRPSLEGQVKHPALFNSPLSGLFENFFGDDLFSKEFASFVPAVNTWEDGSKYHLELSAPGFEKENFSIRLEKGLLLVSGQHKTESAAEERNFSRKEFNYGSFQRSFMLPEDVNENDIDAKYENGILKIFLPKKEEAKRSSREISIN